MDAAVDSRSGATSEHGRAEAIRLVVNVAQSECVCTFHLCFCVLTDTGERSGLQPFLYEQGFAF